MLLIATALTACNKSNSELKTSDSPDTDSIYQKSVAKDVSAENIVAIVGGREITYKEMLTGIETEVYELEKKAYDLKSDRLQLLMLEILIAKDEKNKDLGIDQYIEKFIASDIEVSESDIETFIKKRGIAKHNLTDDLNEKIKEFLFFEKQKKEIDKWIAKSTKDDPVKVFLTKPGKPRFNVSSGESPYMGGKDAKVTIVEYSDFQCPFCKRGAAVMEEVKKKYGDKVKIVFKNFPLHFHKHAHQAAQAGMCANEQSMDKFWKLHDLMFADQQGLNIEGLIEKAEKADLDVEEFKVCLETKRYAEAVDKDMEEGARARVRSTPTFFVNGKVLSGAHALEAFVELIEEDLNPEG